jgi:hypothetical protein
MLRAIILGDMSVATIETNDYLTCVKAGKVLKLSPDTVRRYLNNAKEGKTPALEGTQFGRDWLIHKNEIQRYKRERRGRGRQPNGK